MISSLKAEKAKDKENTKKLQGIISALKAENNAYKVEKEKDMQNT